MQEKNKKILSISEKISQLIDNLRITRYKFSQETGISETVLLNIYKGKNNPSYEIIQKILKTYKVNANWLLSDDNLMFVNKKNTQNISSKNFAIPLIPINAIAGFGTGDCAVKECEIEDRYIIPDWSGKADFLIKVMGDSMEPCIMGGDIAGCCIIRERTFIQWGRIHLIDSEQGPVIKRLYDGKKGMLICKSENANYQPFMIPSNSIRSIALVIGTICHK